MNIFFDNTNVDKEITTKKNSKHENNNKLELLYSFYQKLLSRKILNNIYSLVIFIIIFLDIFVVFNQLSI